MKSECLNLSSAIWCLTSFSFDLDMPVECDDEYWEHNDPDQAFKQPPEMPSVIAYFNSSLKLSQILAFALRTIVSTEALNRGRPYLTF
jgi:hypothetical protein